MYNNKLVGNKFILSSNWTHLRKALLANAAAAGGQYGGRWRSTADERRTATASDAEVIGDRMSERLAARLGI